MVYPFLSLSGIEHVNPPSAIKAHRVSTVGGYGKHRDGMITTLIGCFCGMFFGALHCLGWKYLFRTQARRLLWQGTSVVITISPALFLLSFGYYKLWSRNSKSKSKIAVGDIFLIFLLVLILVTFLTYILARALLLVLMVLSFLSLPPSAYYTVAWTKFFPHL